MNESRGWMPGRKLFFAVVGAAVVALVALSIVLANGLSANQQLAAENSRLAASLSSSKLDAADAKRAHDSCIDLLEIALHDLDAYDRATVQLAVGYTVDDLSILSAATEQIREARESVGAYGESECLAG